MPTDARTNRLLAQAISKLKSEGFEKHLCFWIKELLQYDNTSMIAYFQDKPPEALMLSSEEPKVHENFEKIYVNGAYLLDPFHELHTQKAASGVYQLHAIAPDHFRRNRYFVEYYQNTTLIDEIGFIAYPSDGVSVHLCLGRDSHSKSKFSNREFSVSEMIAPVVCSLIERHYNELSSTGKYDESWVVNNLRIQAQTRHQISLSPRQAQVAMLILRGHSSISIGLQLGISPQTVKVFRKQLYKKCEISSQAELFSLMLPLLRHDI
ncbi:MAG: helix-turn-helix transcriptional regulator [Pseudomonadota bacterium]